MTKVISIASPIIWQRSLASLCSVCTQPVLAVTLRCLIWNLISKNANWINICLQVCSAHWQASVTYWTFYGLTQTNKCFLLNGLTEPSFSLLFCFLSLFCFPSPFLFSLSSTFISQVLQQESSTGWSLFSSSSSSTPHGLEEQRDWGLWEAHSISKGIPEFWIVVLI